MRKNDSKTLCSGRESLWTPGSVRPCSEHGYARVHPSPYIHIYIYIYIPRLPDYQGLWNMCLTPSLKPRTFETDSSNTPPLSERMAPKPRTSGTEGTKAKGLRNGLWKGRFRRQASFGTEVPKPRACGTDACETNGLWSEGGSDTRPPPERNLTLLIPCPAVFYPSWFSPSSSVDLWKGSGREQVQT